jgi:Na+-transporting NADH:ubiquinone oxidoreductase subunit NqrB
MGNHWLVFLVLTVTFGLSFWYLRNTASSVIKYGLLLVFIIMALATLMALPHGNTNPLYQEKPKKASSH